MAIEYNTATRLHMRWGREGRFFVRTDPNDALMILPSECVWIVPGTITE
jgi:hypothetical protein